MDEAWRFIQHDTLRRYVESALKTWRKHKAVMWLATQTLDDFTSADLLRTVIEGCPTRLLLANPAFDRERYAELLGLNEAALDLLTGLLPRRELLLQRPGLAKVLALHVDRQIVLAPHQHAGGQRTRAHRVRGARLPRRPRAARLHRVTREHSMRLHHLSLAVFVLASTVGLTAQSVGVREITVSDRSVVSLTTRLRYRGAAVIEDHMSNEEDRPLVDDGKEEHEDVYG